jgi:hypothetical protein
MASLEMPYLNSKMRHRIIKETKEFVEKQGFKWWITANFNRETTKEQGFKKLREWHGRIDRALHGRCFYKKKKDERLFFIACPETGGYSECLHYHILAKMPECSEEEFKLIAEPTWLQLVTCGSLDVQEIGDTKADQEKVIGYGLKEVWVGSNYENFIISTQFSSVH